MRIDTGPCGIYKSSPRPARAGRGARCGARGAGRLRSCSCPCLGVCASGTACVRACFPLRVSVCRCARRRVCGARSPRGDVRSVGRARHEARPRGVGGGGGGGGQRRRQRGGGRARQERGGAHGGLVAGGRPAPDPAGARAAAAVRAQQHARGQLLHAGQEPVGRRRRAHGLERSGRAAQVVPHPQLVLAPPAQRDARHVHDARPHGVALVPRRRAGVPARAHGHRHAADVVLVVRAHHGGPGAGAAVRGGREAVPAEPVVRAGRARARRAPGRAQRRQLRLVRLRGRRELVLLPVLPRHPRRLPGAAGAQAAPVQAQVPGAAARVAGRGGGRAPSARRRAVSARRRHRAQPVGRRRQRRRAEAQPGRVLHPARRQHQLKVALPDITLVNCVGAGVRSESSSRSVADKLTLQGGADWLFL